MASSKDYLDFILEQLSELDDIEYKTMMGEYIIYYRGKVIKKKTTLPRSIYHAGKLLGSTSVGVVTRTRIAGLRPARLLRKRNPIIAPFSAVRKKMPGKFDSRPFMRR